jgi:hypothetical protein
MREIFEQVRRGGAGLQFVQVNYRSEQRNFLTYVISPQTETLNSVVHESRRRPEGVSAIARAMRHSRLQMDGWSQTKDAIDWSKSKLEQISGSAIWIGLCI